MKTAELEGQMLDYWVARAENVEERWLKEIKVRRMLPFHYSENWALAGPILERERIELFTGPDYWGAASDTSDYDAVGPTPLVAAMRLHVMNHFGEEVADEEGFRPSGH